MRTETAESKSNIPWGGEDTRRLERALWAGKNIPQAAKELNRRQDTCRRKAVEIRWKWSHIWSRQLESGRWYTLTDGNGSRKMRFSHVTSPGIWGKPLWVFTDRKGNKETFNEAQMAELDWPPEIRKTGGFRRQVA